MTVTTRAGKGSALSHNELDANFNDLSGVSANSGDLYIADGAGAAAWAPFTIPHGEIHSVPADAVTIGTIGTTQKKLAAFTTDGETSGVTVSAASDQITVLTAGVYYVEFTISFATTASGDSGDYQFVVRKNAVETSIGIEREMSGSSDTGSSSTAGILSLAASDVITVYVESDSGGDSDDIDIKYASLSVFRIGA